jgi:hypothetical protein
MSEITSTLTEYAGTVPNRLTQTQAQYDAAATTLMDYWVVVCPELNAIATEYNGLRTELIAIETAVDADRVQTGLDRTQTGLDRTQT